MITDSNQAFFTKLSGCGLQEEVNTIFDLVCRVKQWRLNLIRSMKPNSRRRRYPSAYLMPGTKIFCLKNGIVGNHHFVMFVVMK